MTGPALAVGADPVVSPGVGNDTASTLLRKFLNPALRGPVWTAVVAALASADAVNTANAAAAFDQLFRSTASGTYLDRILGDDGISRPPGMGMSDADFRTLGIGVNAHKLTEASILQVLAIFYGNDAVHAYAETATAEPYDLTLGQTLTIVIDEVETVTLTLQSQDSSSPATMTAAEVAAALTRTLTRAGVGAYAIPYSDPGTGLNRVRIYSQRLGLRSSVRVSGGTMQPQLQFPAISSEPVPGTTPSTLVWSVAVNGGGGSARYTMTGGALTAFPLQDVVVGDYAVVSGANFSSSNCGSFAVVNVYCSSSGTYYVDLANTAATAQAGVQQTTLGDVLFFRPQRQSIQQPSQRTVSVLMNGDGASVNVPATAAAVQRQAGEAAYLNNPPSYTITALAYGFAPPGSSILPINGTVSALTPFPVSSGTAQAFISGSSGPGVNGLQTVTILSNTTFTYTPTKSASFPPLVTAQTAIQLCTAQPASSTGISGPYIYDTESAVGGGITNVQTTTVTPIGIGQQLSQLQLTSTAGIPSGPGYLVLGWGLAQVAGPVPYLGVIDSTHLLLDYRYRFPQALPSGSSCIVLTQKGPWVPAAPQACNSFYLSDSCSGRVAAVATLKDIDAAGAGVGISITYPGDTGLGGAGRPVLSAPRLSDVVWVWGGNQPDADYALAQQGVV